MCKRVLAVIIAIICMAGVSSGCYNRRLDLQSEPYTNLTKNSDGTYSCLISSRTNEKFKQAIAKVEHPESIKTMNILAYDGEDIIDITPLALFENLEELELIAATNDLTPLASLTKLGFLVIRGGSQEGGTPPIKNVEEGFLDLTPLAFLKELKHLRIEPHNKFAINDMTPLGSLTKLEYLDLWSKSSQMSDITVITSLVCLKELRLSGCQISDIAPLNLLTDLEKLDLSRNTISDLSPLASLTNLKELDLADNSIDDAVCLASLENLEWLNLSYNKINDITPFKSLTGLKKLYLSGNNITGTSVDDLKKALPDCEITSY